MLCVGAFTAIHLTMLGLFGVALSKRRTENQNEEHVAKILHQIYFNKSRQSQHCVFPRVLVINPAKIAELLWHTLTDVDDKL